MKFAVTLTLVRGALENWKRKLENEERRENINCQNSPFRQNSKLQTPIFQTIESTLGKSGDSYERDALENEEARFTSAYTTSSILDETCRFRRFLV